MNARRLWLTVVVCGLACALALWMTSALAGAAQFGGHGHGAGELNSPMGVGVDQETGDVYVGEFQNERVSKFESSGGFLLAWGWKIDEEKPAEELQTCTLSSGCLKGESGPGAGEFAGACGAEGVAVDNDPLSASYHDVYVVDFCHMRVQKFDPSGRFLLMFGGNVNEAKDNAPGATQAEKNLCVAGEACTRGTQGTADGEFEWAYEHSYIAVGPAGNVYVGDKARVQVFEPSGAWKENVSLTALSATGRVTGLAVDSSGDVFVTDEGISGVRELEPGGIERATQFDAGSSSIEAIALNGAGDVFVADGAGGFHVDEYEPSGQQLAGFGFHTASFTHGIAFSDALNELYATGESVVWALSPPALGPVVEPESEQANPELRGAATLAASVDPEGNATTVHFEYVDQTRFEASGYAAAASTAPQSVGSGFTEESVEVQLPQKTLTPGVTYHWRAVAIDSSDRTATGPDQSFEEIPAALVDGPWASDVAATSATLSARIDPQGASTSYRLEYGSEGSYQHAFTGNVGEGNGYVPIGYHLQELRAGTAYRYRLITESEAGTVEVVHTFTTQPASEQLTLPDGRAWELVSPPDKKAALIEPHEAWLAQAAGDGSGITYAVNEPLGEGEQGVYGASQILSTRAASGWASRQVGVRVGLPPEGQSAKNYLGGFQTWPLFSTDLTLGVMAPVELPTLQSPEATEQTIYRFDAAANAFTPLETQANVLTGAKFADGYLHYDAATPDLGHIVFATWAPLTPEAQAGDNRNLEQNLYEWHAGQLQLVNILPDGTTKPGAVIGDGEAVGAAPGMTARAISSDGRWVVFHYGQVQTGEQVALYARDMVGKQTFRLGHSHARFETMSGQNARVFFIENEPNQVSNGDLYVFDPHSGTQTDITADHPGEASANVQNAVLGASEDGSYVYFVATGALASGAAKGQDNLYVAHDGSGGWTIEHIATLSHEDERTWGLSNRQNVAGTSLEHTESEASPDGRYLAFMSSRPLTGYDNRDAVSGQPDEEVFLYDAASKRLVCASCNPSGARPVGLQDVAVEEEAPLMDIAGAWRAGVAPHWLAASLLPWTYVYGKAPYHARFVFDSGRLFFNSPDALVPQDTNGFADAYEYEPSGVGNCTRESQTFSEASQGCVSLLSSGVSAAESVFMDASETGDDAFFVTTSRLTPSDYDTAYDMYDAHVCSSAAPCHATPVSPPPCTSGDSCKAAPSPQPELFGPTPSETFNGRGNVVASGPGRISRRARCAKGRVRRGGRCVKRNRRRRRGAKRMRRGKPRHARGSMVGTAIGRGK